MAKIFLACGHGGSDVGAVGKNVYERDLAISIANQAEKLLKTQKLGKTYVRVPDSLALTAEVAWINKNLASASHDVAINLHFNANAGTPGTGTETWYGHKTLATEVNTEVAKVLGLKNRGVKRNDLFWFNRSVKCASCILEMGFVNNTKDVETIKKNGGLALAKAIVKASNGTWKNTTPAPAPTPVKPPVAPAPVKPVPTPTPTPKPTPEAPKESEVDVLNKILVLLQGIWESIKKKFNL